MKRKEKLKTLLEEIFKNKEISLEEIVALAAEVYNEDGTQKSESVKSRQDFLSVSPGMFVYEDGTIRAKILPDKVVGVIVSVVKGRALAVGLEQVSLPWSTDLLVTKTSREVEDGQKATCLILEEACKQNKEAEAAKWCFTSCEARGKKGAGFLPSLANLEMMFANKDVVNASLRQLHAPGLEGSYWCSTEFSDKYACCMDMGYFLEPHYFKNLRCHTRAVFWVEL